MFIVFNLKIFVDQTNPVNVSMFCFQERKINA